MDFFDFPLEIRLKIYSEILVQDESVDFETDHGPCNLRLVRLQQAGFSPAVLRVNKKINAEAIPLLYSKNRFRFPDAYISESYDQDVPYVAPFLRQIGSNANLLRHICINFRVPLVSCWTPTLHKDIIQTFELIREKCTNF
nr:uncharacterized protein CTRU02_10178 [Colletotrichum truncatum]KAF6787382.1 hypothetical protein CTRU02_10178 [Colletotrichum truncatum]